MKYMIYEILEAIASDMNSFFKNTLGLDDGMVILSGIANQDGSLALSGDNKIVITLQNIENQVADKTTAKQDKIEIILHVLFSANFPGSKYQDGLKFLSLAVSYLKEKSIFGMEYEHVKVGNPGGGPGVYLSINMANTSDIKKLIFEPENMSSEKQSSMWAALGATYMPSVLYKVSLLAPDPPVTAIETAVPVFIGYTDIAVMNGRPLVNRPTYISSFAEYENYFGGGFTPKYTITDVTPAVSDVPVAPPPGSFRLGDRYFVATIKPGHAYYLYNCIKLFYANGGNKCQILSVGTYRGQPDGVLNKKADDFINAIKLLEMDGYTPTLVVIPDAVTFGVDCYSSIYQSVLAHCNNTQSRFAIFDLLKDTANDKDIAVTFRNNIGDKYLNYGAAYYPWLNTTAVDAADVSLENIDLTGIDELSALLTNDALAARVIAQAKRHYGDILKIKAGDQPLVANSGPLTAEQITGIRKNFNESLKEASPLYRALLKELVTQINQLPPCTAMAGIYTMVDSTAGIWKPPTNYSLAMVSSPVVNVTDEYLQGLDIDCIAGKSINAIRQLPGADTLIWDGRTLDGNSQDWRYINVRRTIMMIEQSVKLITRAYVFEPNTGITWYAIKTRLNNFLYNLWQQGALIGRYPEDGFSVRVGLGITMTPEDILDGIMKIEILLAVVTPAEFIEFTFQQQQQQS